MQIAALVTVAIFATTAFARLHSAAVCIKGRKYGSTGNGTPWGLTYGSYKDYEILPEATKCACDMYRRRNTGNKQWDQCPDCTYMHYYCNKKCGAEGSEAN
ncbi:hypothetical protein CCHL11_05309 [Colletotrichum chlorophyti]|uniref:Uncharacterized protein n=1 Tax=Colletotrichum chlorophyti TaxID=708187 RepID=A0A1Q8RP07_9PEZI|nr:hypothetical protein CCHL11_05309 [Colletotrichum chlorophyti]